MNATRVFHLIPTLCASVRFMDIGERFLQPDGSISEEVMPDGMHPSERGYEIWADAVMPTFREMMGR